MNVRVTRANMVYVPTKSMDILVHVTQDLSALIVTLLVSYVSFYYLISLFTGQKKMSTWFKTRKMTGITFLVLSFFKVKSVFFSLKRKKKYCLYICDHVISSRDRT